MKLLIVTNTITEYREPLYKLLNDKYNCFWILTQESEEKIVKINWLNNKKNYFIPKKIYISNLVPITFIFFKLFKINYDYVLSLPSVYPESWQVFLASKIKGKKIILWDEEFIGEKSFKRRLIMPFTNFINKKSDFILVPTAIHKDYQISKGVNKDKIIFFPNVTNLDGSYNKDNIKNIKDKYGLEDKKVILFVGRLIKLKGVQYLINAYYNLLIEKDYLKENIILLIVGEGDYKKELIELSNKILDIGGNIIFLGKINNNELNDYYEISDFGVIPSINYNGISDAYALVVNEFLVHGKPVIVSNMVGASGIIKLHSEFGYIVEEKSSNDLKEKIYKLLSINNSDSLTLNIKEIINKYNSYEKGLKILENIFLIK